MWYYFFEIIRNEQGEVTNRIVRYSSNKKHLSPEYEHGVIESEEEVDLFKKVSVDENGVAFLEEDADAIALQASEDAIALRIKRIAFGQRLVAIMSIRNDAKSLTGAQIVQLVNDFADINTAWLNGSISTSRALIDALTPDETILTTADKTAILAEIDANLTALGY